MDAFTRVPTAGKIAMRFGESEESEDVTDRLVGVSLLTEEDDVLLATKCGKAIRFAATDVREFQSRTAAGVRGIALRRDDEVISLSILHRVGTTQEEKEDYLRYAPWKPEKDGQPIMPAERFEELKEREQFILTVCARGYGKLSSAYDYRRIGRGGQGLINIENIERNGPVVASFPARHGDQLMLVTDQAKMIRIPIELRGQTESDKALRVLSRGSAGVKLFDVAEGELVVSAARIDEEEEPENPAEEMVAEELAGQDGESRADAVQLDDGTGPETLPERVEEEEPDEDEPQQ
jgi:DNA gyrase subunit A